jgi:tripartite-type tricarboxylate transporter receptor subunit TctC
MISKHDLICSTAAILVAVLGSGAAAQPASAQSYPAKPIHIVVPFPPGTGADLSTRRVAEPMSKILGQPIVIENRAGAGGVVGASFVAKAAPDGYTLLAGTLNTHALNPGLYKALPYDPIRDFAPITRIVSFPNVLVVPSSLQVSAMPQLVDIAKKRQGEGKSLTYASGGNGTTAHLAGAQLAQQIGTDLLHIPYKGTSLAMTDVMAGRVDMIFGNIPVLLPHVRSGALNAVAISTPARSKLMPDVPTVSEVGMPEMEMAVWIALLAPAGTPPDIVQKLHAAALEALQSATVKNAYEQEGSTVEVDKSPAEFGRVLKADVEKWTRVIKATGATAD